MTIEEIKKEAELLSSKKQAELIARLVQVRLSKDRKYRREITKRLSDKNPSHWLTLEEFERRLANQ